MTDSTRHSSPPSPSPTGSPTGPGPSTLAVHAGEARQKAVHAITDPIVCASTYTFANTQAVIDFIEQKQDREEYGRYGNPGEKVVERKLAALEGGEDAVLYASGMAAIVGLLDDEAQRRRRGRLLRRVLPPQPRVLHQAPVAVRRGHAAGEGLRLRRDGGGDQSADEAAGQRIADQSAPERRRSGAVRRARAQAPRRDADRRHAGHALQRAAARSTASITSCTRRPSTWAATTTCLAGVIIGSREQARAGPQAARHHGGDQLAAQHVSARARAEDVRAADAAAQRQRPGGRRVPGGPSARREGLLSGPANRIRTTTSPSRQMRGFGGLVTFLVKDADWKQTAAVVDASARSPASPRASAASSRSSSSRW